MMKTNAVDVSDDEQDGYKINDFNVGLKKFRILPFANLTNGSLINFKVPFTVKVMGPRGSGKTSFTVSYISLNVQYLFKHIYFITSTPDQNLLDCIRNLPNVSLFSVGLLDDALFKRYVLIVLDNLMQEVWNSKQIESIYSKGKHKKISFFSIEQDTNLLKCN